MKQLLLSHDAARVLRLTPESIRALERLGHLRAVARTPNGTRLFDMGDVERLRQEREQRAGTPGMR